MHRRRDGTIFFLTAAPAATCAHSSKGDLRPWTVKRLRAEGARTSKAIRLGVRTPTSGRKSLRSPSDRVEPMPPERPGARSPPAGGANAVAGTRPSNPRSIRILVSASRSNGCPTCALSQVGLTPSSGVGSCLQWGLGQVQENCGALQLDADRYQAAVSCSSSLGCPHPWGSATARGATIGGRPVQRAPKPAFALATGIARPNRSPTAGLR